MNTNRVFTEEDKKSLPKVYIQQDTPEDNNNLHFKVKSVETDSEGVEHVNADLEHNYNGKKQKLNVSTTSDMIKMKNSDKSLDDQLSVLTDTVIEEVLLAANWVPGTNIPYTNRLNVSVPIEYDVQVVLNTNNKEIVEQCAKANIISGDHQETYIIMNAFSTKPTVDIPIKLIVIPREESTEDDYELPPATEEELGGVIPGEGTEVENSALVASQLRTALDELNEASI